MELDLPSSEELSGFDPEEQLATRAAWLYFVGSNTQAEIGKKLGLTRVRINRLLALAREQGLVQIKVTGRLADCVALEEQLKERFKLHHAVVVPTPLNRNQREANDLLAAVNRFIPHAIRIRVGNLK